MEETIVKALNEHRSVHRKSDTEDLPKGVADLIDTNPFAFLIGSVFQRGMSWRKAWEIPFHIDLHGMLEPSKLTSATDGELRALFENLPVKPRYPNKGVRTLKEAADLVEAFGGNAAAIWTGTPPRVVRQASPRNLRCGTRHCHHGSATPPRPVRLLSRAGTRD